MKIEVIYFSKKAEKHGIYSESSDFFHFFSFDYISDSSLKRQNEEETFISLFEINLLTADQKNINKTKYN